MKDPIKESLIAMSKVTSARDNILIVKDLPVYKNIVKHEIEKFIKFYDKFVEKVDTKIYSDNNASRYEFLVEQFEQFDECVTVGSDTERNMFLIYVKLKSAMDHFTNISGDKYTKLFCLVIAGKINKLLSFKFWNQYTALMNTQQIQGADEFIQSMNQLSDKLILA